MRSVKLLSCMLPVLLLCCLSLQALDTNAVALLKSAPRISGEWYRCGDMVRAVNGLRRLGKSQATEVLRSHVLQNGNDGPPGEEMKLHLVCRLLFVSPQGWKYPHLGHPFPEVDWSVAEQYPLFPIALSRGVPFLLLRGYGMAGWTDDTGKKCVDRCESFSLISADLPESGFREAAEELVKSETFQRLYLSAEGRKEATDMILAQADPARPQVRGASSIRVAPAPEAQK